MWRCRSCQPGRWAPAVVDGERADGGGGVGAAVFESAVTLDELRIDLVPVVLGGGVRVLRELVHAGKLARFEEPTIIVGQGVTHLDCRLWG